LPWPLRVAAAWSWRLLLVMALIAVLAHVLVALRIAVLPALLALFLVPLALPLAVLTFFGAFVPIVGALATGMAAVLVALVSGGLDLALATTAAVIVVQQVESHVLHPLVIGRALSVHPCRHPRLRHRRSGGPRHRRRVPGRSAARRARGRGGDCTPWTEPRTGRRC
jgi:hypothetical protein